MFLMCANKNGVAALELKRQLGVTYKTAWRMAHAIRRLMQDDPDGPDKLKGTVEGDETYWGGKTTGGKRGRGAPNKTPIVGYVERNGRVRVKVVSAVNTREVFRFLYLNVEKGSTLYTDELAVYNYARRWGYDHDRVNHRRKEWVRGPVHTNTIEGFWSTCKNDIRGVYHAVSAKYLQYYLNEYSFRYNHRDDVTPMFWSFLRLTALPCPQEA